MVEIDGLYSSRPKLENKEQLFLLSQSTRPTGAREQV